MTIITKREEICSAFFSVLFRVYAAQWLDDSIELDQLWFVPSSHCAGLQKAGGSRHQRQNGGSQQSERDLRGSGSDIGPLGLEQWRRFGRLWWLGDGRLVGGEQGILGGALLAGCGGCWAVARGPGGGVSTSGTGSGGSEWSVGRQGRTSTPAIQESQMGEGTLSSSPDSRIGVLSQIGEDGSKEDVLSTESAQDRHQAALRGVDALFDVLESPAIQRMDGGIQTQTEGLVGNRLDGPVHGRGGRRGRGQARATIEGPNGTVL
ncbi:hypothetical protein Dimus_009912 [Dionaea muscipula]